MKLYCDYELSIHTRTTKFITEKLIKVIKISLNTEIKRTYKFKYLGDVINPNVLEGMKEKVQKWKKLFMHHKKSISKKVRLRHYKQ